MMVMSVVQRERELAAAFESRWTLLALRRVDPVLWADLQEQGEMYSNELADGDDAAITEQGEAMCRGWAIAIRCMAVAQVQDLWPGAEVVDVRSKPIQGDGEC